MDGDFDLIQQNVTPKTLTNCKTNALLKAFEVSYLFCEPGLGFEINVLLLCCFLNPEGTLCYVSLSRNLELNKDPWALAVIHT